MVVGDVVWYWNVTFTSIDVGLIVDTEKRNSDPGILFYKIITGKGTVIYKSKAWLQKIK